ncbi:MAG TPA: SDR family NAD(P)-dependent oxidoreductase [Bacteroidia bacterium]|jgi:retinol dehydrogenase-14|nr:SDR family NAD(P)-dependent oxidoreductase [Bacteroidia bacterium]
MGKIIFITGATSGIGLVTACELAADGHTVIATARSSEKGNLLLEHCRKNYFGNSGKIEIELCDLSSFESIVNTCNTVKARYSQIDTIINNAGTWNSGFRESKDKIEETLQVNVLAPLLINHLLYSSLAKSPDAKSIFTASALHQGYVDFSNLEFRNRFSGFKSYRQSKLEIILLCRLLAKKLAQSNIGVYCQHPGLVNTNLSRDAGWFFSLVFRFAGISPKKGAETLIYLAKQDKAHLVSGEYYTLKAVKKITPQSYDMQVAQRLSDKLKTYLTKYIGSSSSPIFEK